MTDEQIIAAAGEPVVRTSDVLKLFRLFNSGKLTPNTIDGWTSALEIYELTQSTADAILAATKPLRDRIAELEAARKDVEWQPIETAPKGD